MSEPKKANLIQSMALGGSSALFAVNFTHRKFSFSFSFFYFIVALIFYWIVLFHAFVLLITN